MPREKVNLTSILTVLALLQQLSEPDAPVEELLGGSVQVRTKLGEGSDLTVLSQLQLHGTSHLEEVRGRGKKLPNLLNCFFKANKKKWRKNLKKSEK